MSSPLEYFARQTDETVSKQARALFSLLDRVWSEKIALNWTGATFFHSHNNGKCVTETGYPADNSNPILNIEGTLYTGILSKGVLSYTGLMPVGSTTLWKLYEAFFSAGSVKE